VVEKKNRIIKGSIVKKEVPKYHEIDSVYLFFAFYCNFIGYLS